jgi:hypothetical protein
MLPIVMILMAILAVQGRDRGNTPNARQLLLVSLLASLAHSVALHSLMRRYITGLDVASLDLDTNAEWWWDVPVQPMLIWALGSVAFAALAVIIAARAGQVGCSDPTPNAVVDNDLPVGFTMKAHDSVSAGVPTRSADGAA